MKSLPFLILLLVLTSSGCSEPALQLTKPGAPAVPPSVTPGAPQTLDPPETFTEADRPVNVTAEGQGLWLPWGYAKAENASRLYPAIISGYHGEGGEHWSPRAQEFPAFDFAYKKDSEADGAALAQWIEKAIAAGWRIDKNRIYLTGFSRGGSGSYALARGMASRGLYFAGIVRVAGGSQSDLGNAIAARTAVWYHIGLTDSADRVQVARDALAFFRGYPCNSGAVESQVTDTLTGFTRSTTTLTRGGWEMVKYSEYTAMGHDPAACYKDPALLPWLFSQSLARR